MRTMILIAAGLLTLAMACSSTGTSTPRSTNTPVPLPRVGAAEQTATSRPTYTPYPLPPVGAAERTTTPRPTYTPYPLPPIERTGSIELLSGIPCDDMLRDQLLFQHGATTAHQMNIIISHIQGQRQGCDPDLWNPTVVDLSTDVGNCYGNIGMVATSADETKASKKSKVGDANMPTGLLVRDSSAYSSRTASGRDNENNIIVYFNLDPPKRPADQASCWLYDAHLKQWHENFHIIP